MAFLDLRHVLVVALNILKSQTAAMPWEWDSFTIASDLTWIKFWLLLILLFVFCFVSIRIPLASPTMNMGYVQVRIKNLSASLLTSFIALVFFPQILFWYTYPLIMLFFLCYSGISNVSRSFVFWVQAVLPALPDLNVFITTNSSGEEADVEEGRIQA